MRKLIVSLLLLFFAIEANSFALFDPSCEMQAAPLAVEAAVPRFGWKMSSDTNENYQTAYQIIVYDGAVKVWDSGRVKSSQSQLVAYAGKPLAAGKRYGWTVKAWDKSGKAAESSSFFDTAPVFGAGDVVWIGAISREAANLPVGRRDFHNPSMKNAEEKAVFDAIDTLALRSIALRKSFENDKKIERAMVHVSGLGQYTLTLNGKNVSEDIFTPAWSDYDKTLYYNTYQVNDLLRAGENVIGVVLGNGFYNAVGNRYRKLWVTFGPPTLFFRMEIFYTDGTTRTISSDATWKYVPSPITFNDIYGGEDYDARLEQAGWDAPGFDDRLWKPVVVQGAPEGMLRPQQLTNVRKMEEFGAVKMTKIGDSYVLDMGQNLSGYPAIKVKGKRGQTVTVTPGEQLNPETGLVSQRQSGGRHSYSYTLKGDGVETWHPQFSYYGFQYIQIDGADILSSDGERPLLIDVKSHFIYNSVKNLGSFESSNEIFNKVHALIKNAVKSNMQSIFTDCPHREKLAWLEETYLNGPGLLYNWDLTQFYPKVMRDIADAQRPGGMVPTTAPEYVLFDDYMGDTFMDSPEWGMTAIMVPWLYYNFYGDNSLIEKYFDVMKRYVDYLGSRADAYIVSHGLGDWYDYSDQRAGFSVNSPVNLSATAHYFYSAKMVAAAAEMLKKDKDQKKYTALAAKIREAYNNKFFDKTAKQYGTGSQYCNAVSIYMGIVEPQYKDAVMENLKADIRKHGNRLTTGDIGNRYLFQTLALNGENELMYLMHNHTDVPGYGFQLQFGVTTLTEQWDPRQGASWNHFMMGQIDEWFFASLAGIMPSQNGFRDFTVSPRVVGDMTWVKARHETLYGNIAVEWHRNENKFNMSVEVPVNTTATIELPDGSKRTVGSGIHKFECKI